jgi:hypothetical protein
MSQHAGRIEQQLIEEIKLNEAPIRKTDSASMSMYTARTALSC